jgi:dihydrofolate reductase
MSQVISSASMSLDGFVAHPDDLPGRLFDWYDNGEVDVATAAPDLAFKLTPQSAAYWREWTTSLGALVVGRRLFDITNGWGGRHPIGVPVVVVTHDPPVDWDFPDAALEFETGGVAAAIDRARRIAAGRNVGVAAGTIARQCLELGLLDEVAIDLVPEVLGVGKPYFGELASGAVALGEPSIVIHGRRVTHLRFPVRR